MVNGKQETVDEKKRRNIAGLGIPPRWKIHDIDWDGVGFPGEEREKTEVSKDFGDIGSIQHFAPGRVSVAGEIEIDLTDIIENEKLGFERHAIIANIIGSKLPRKHIRNWVEVNWGKHIMIKFLPKGFFVVVFPEESERNETMASKNWLYNIPIEYWSEPSLETIGRTLGSLLEIDEEIIAEDLYTYARLKITIVRTISTSITLITSDGNWKQLIEIEEVTGACSRCGSKLHNVDRCKLFVRRAFDRPKRKKTNQAWREKKEENLISDIPLLDGPISMINNETHVAGTETIA
ncbi:hypothetical protein SUGI_0228390 [Cryptomeria japonica]|nr:hypothetical protein SUGI_0228390 [Cryptomeria japonica]